MTTKPGADLERALKNVNTSIRYYEAELSRTSALKPRFKYLQGQIAALKSRQWKLERDINTLKENGKEESE